MLIRSTLLTPLGTMFLEEKDEQVIRLVFCDSPSAAAYHSPLSLTLQTELTAYFDGRQPTFSVPLQPDLTPYQEKVFRVLSLIPYGHLTTYGELTHALSRGSAMATGQALKRNPIHILIPCHRVVGKDHQLTGYAGGLWRKKALLRLEHAPGI
ncbi:MAG: methylated-DNA--[Clostridia bacterium]|nr:methylated-DNA--[protein]-cysteine S-methyltransferase [Clostridia bacterium]